MSTQLRNYVTELQTKKVGLNGGWVNTDIKTLWIPENSSNRTAMINLNHTILGFDEKENLFGENGNCLTRYQIIELPATFTETDLKKLAEQVSIELGLDYSLRNLVTANIQKIRHFLNQKGV